MNISARLHTLLNYPHYLTPSCHQVDRLLANATNYFAKPAATKASCTLGRAPTRV